MLAGFGAMTDRRPQLRTTGAAPQRATIKNPRQRTVRSGPVRCEEEVGNEFRGVVGVGAIWEVWTAEKHRRLQVRGFERG